MTSTTRLDAIRSKLRHDHAASEATWADGAIIDGEPRVVFGGCNYLGLAHHPRVIAAATDAMARFGLSSAASRTTTGNTTAHHELEATIEGFFAGVAPEHLATCTIDGMTANIAAFEGLARSCDLAIVDELAHRSIALAATAAGMRIRTYRHRDAEHAALLARDHANSAACVIATDSVFASTGSIAPLGLLQSLAPPETTLLVDECHGVGVIGPTGRGLAASEIEVDHRTIMTCTLAKAIGCHGGFVLAPPDLATWIRENATAYVGTTPTLPAIAAAAAESLRLLNEEPQRLARLHACAAKLHRAFPTQDPRVDKRHVAPIVVIEPKASAAANMLAELLHREGLRVPLLTYPGGPSSPYFRISCSSEHRPQDIDTLIQCVSNTLGPDTIAWTPPGY